MRRPFCAARRTLFIKDQYNKFKGVLANMKNKIKVFLLVAGVIAMCTAVICFILHHSETEDDNPMFI